jgi:general stress protein YciG
VKNPDVVEENTGRAHLPEAAKLGGRAVVEKYGSEHMAEIGRKGSRAVVKRYGLRFYSEIAARNRGVKKRRKPVEPKA